MRNNNNRNETYARTPIACAYEPSKSFQPPPTDKKSNRPASKSSVTDASDIERRYAEFLKGKNAAHAALLASKEQGEEDEIELEENKAHSYSHSTNISPPQEA